LRRDRRGEDRVLEVADLMGRVRRSPIRLGLAGLAKAAVEFCLSVFEDVVKSVPGSWFG
jgi:hypothetical protein